MFQAKTELVTFSGGDSQRSQRESLMRLVRESGAPEFFFFACFLFVCLSACVSICLSVICLFWSQGLIDQTGMSKQFRLALNL